MALKKSNTATLSIACTKCWIDIRRVCVCVCVLLWVCVVWNLQKSAEIMCGDISHSIDVLCVACVCGSRYTKYLLSNMQHICIEWSSLYLTKITGYFINWLVFVSILCHWLYICFSFSLLCVYCVSGCVYRSVRICSLFFPFFPTNVHFCVCAHFIVGYFCVILFLSHRGEFDSHRVIIILWLFHDTKCCQTKQQ